MSRATELLVKFESAESDFEKYNKILDKMGFEEMIYEFTEGDETITPGYKSDLEKFFKFCKTHGIRKVKLIHEPEGGIVDGRFEHDFGRGDKTYKYKDTGLITSDIIIDKKQKLMGLSADGYPGILLGYKFS